MKSRAWLVCLVVMVGWSAAGCGCGDDDDDDNDDAGQADDDDNDDDDNDDNDDSDDDTSDVTIERVWGGAPGHTGIELVGTSDGQVHVAAVKGRSLVLYEGVPGAKMAETEIAPFAYDQTIAVDSADYLHLVYTDIPTGDLVYTTNAGGSWAKQTIVAGGDVEWAHASLALDAQDAPRVAFYAEGVDLDDYGSRAVVRYAALAGGSWNIEDIDDTDGWIGAKDISLALDGQGNAHIVYENMEALELRYAANAGGDWTIAAVDSGEDVGDFCSIGVDAEGHAHVAYNHAYGGDDDGIYYATNQSGSWQHQKLGVGESGSFRSLRLDAAGHVFIAGSLTGDVALWTDRSGSWERETVTSDEWDAMFASVFVDAEGAARIAYYDHEKGWLKYAANPSKAWTVSVLDDAGIADSPPSLALGPDGAPMIALAYSYAANENGAMILATRSGGTWSGAVVDDQLGWVYGDFGAMTVDPAGAAHVAYTGSTSHYELTYAENSSGDWAYENADPQAGFPEMMAIARDGAGAIHIAYADENSWRLRYTTNAAGSWKGETASTISEYGDGGVALQVQADGTAHVAWYDDENSAVYYATNASGDWAKEEVASDLWLVNALSIQLDADNHAHLAFSNLYATNTGGSWVIEETGLADDPAEVSLAIDAAGYAHIACESFRLRYLSNASGEWKGRVIDHLDGEYYILWNIGDYPSMAIDADGNVHVAYLGEGAVWHAMFPAAKP